MKWNEFKTNPPSGSETMIVMFPCKVENGSLYKVVSAEYAKVNGQKQGYTHWLEIDLSPTHNDWKQWQITMVMERNL